jgi:hypothetical protein
MDRCRYYQQDDDHEDERQAQADRAQMERARTERAGYGKRGLIPVDQDRDGFHDEGEGKCGNEPAKVVAGARHERPHDKAFLDQAHRRNRDENQAEIGDLGEVQDL